MAVETLLKNADKIDKFLSSNEPRQGNSKSKKEVKSNIANNESCKMTTSKGTIQGMMCDDRHQIIIEAQAFGVGQEQCMQNDIKSQGRQISVLIEEKRKVTQLDKMRKIIDSDDGKQMCSK